MARLKQAGEPARTTPRAPPADERLDAFRRHYAATVAFTDALQEARCRRTDHFGRRITETMDAVRPLFAPWNGEIAFYLYMHGSQRFNALKRGLDGVSSRVLTDKLRALADAGVVGVVEEGGARRYALTPHGERVARLLHPLVFYAHNRARV